MTLRRPRLKPIFGPSPDWLAAPSHGDTFTLHALPPNMSAPLDIARPDGQLVAVGLYGNALGQVYMKGRQLYFQDFPGKLFGAGSAPVDCPDGFNAQTPSSLSTGHLRAFHFAQAGKGPPSECLLLLDRALRLYCWQRQFIAGKTVTSFRLVDAEVIAAGQQGNSLRYAKRDWPQSQTWIIDLDPLSGERTVADTWDEVLISVHFGDDVYAVHARSTPNHWLLGSSASAMAVPCEPEDEIIGCAPEALIVVPGDYRSVELRTAAERRTLLTFDEPSVAEAYDPLTRRVAWLGSASRKVTVQSLKGKALT